MRTTPTHVAAALAAFLSLPAVAQQSDDELAAEATDPTASLMSFQLNDWYQASFRDVGGTANQIVFRSAIPWEGFGQPNIFRITVPVFTRSPSGRTGITDTTVFNLTVFNEAWGRWGVGMTPRCRPDATGSPPTSGRPVRLSAS